MSDPDPIGTDARRVTHLRSLGPPPHVCAFCGFGVPRLLKSKPLAWVKARVPPKVLQDHHVVGRSHDGELIVLLCANCHLLAHTRYFNAGIELRFEPDPVKRVARMLEARAAFAELESRRLREWAALLDDRRRGHSDGSENH